MAIPPLLNLMLLITNAFISGGPDLAQYAGKKHINRGRWTKEEDEKLKRLVEVHGERWDFIASHFPDRADVQCQHRWQKVVNPELVKGGTICVLFYPQPLQQVPLIPASAALIIH